MSDIAVGVAKQTRRTERSRTFLRASIRSGSRVSTIDCMIRNMSEKGARIALPGFDALPDHFDLVVPGRGQTFRARRAWRGKEVLGVEFIDPTADAPDHDGLDALRRENTRLATILTGLVQRLEGLGIDTGHLLEL
jgi:hypothetical protein